MLGPPGRRRERPLKVHYDNLPRLHRAQYLLQRSPHASSVAVRRRVMVQPLEACRHGDPGDTVLFSEHRLHARYRTADAEFVQGIRDHGCRKPAQRRDEIFSFVAIRSSSLSSDPGAAVDVEYLTGDESCVRGQVAHRVCDVSRFADPSHRDRPFELGDAGRTPSLAEDLRRDRSRGDGVDRDTAACHLEYQSLHKPDSARLCSGIRHVSRRGQVPNPAPDGSPRGDDDNPAP